MQKWLPLDYSFVLRLFFCLTNFARDNKFFTIIFCHKNEVSETILNKNERKAVIFAYSVGSDVNCNKSLPTIRHCLYTQCVGPLSISSTKEDEH